MILLANALVSKILRTAHKKFDMKVIAIRESKDLTNLRFHELVGNMIAYEMELKRDDVETKSFVLPKSIALKSSESKEVPQTEKDADEDFESSIIEKVSHHSKRVQ